MRGRPLTDRQKQAIRKLRRQGLSVREISRRVPFGTNAIARACRDIVVPSAAAAVSVRAQPVQSSSYGGVPYVEAEETQEEEAQEEETSELISAAELKDMEPEEILARMTALDEAERSALSGLRFALLMGNNESAGEFKTFLYGHRVYTETIRGIEERH